MARVARVSNPVSLFPFLAVLMCTIGALVLLLVVISAQIRANTVEELTTARAKEEIESETVPAEPAPPAVIDPEIKEPTEMFQPLLVQAEPEELPELPPDLAETGQLTRIASLHATSASLLEMLGDRKSGLHQANEKLRSLAGRLREITAREEELKQKNQLLAAERDDFEKRQRELRAERQGVIELIDSTNELIREQEARLATPTHSLIAYDGQTGTIRKPIIIECVKGAIRFTAEEVELSTERLARYPPGQNPLVAGIVALMNYWSERNREAGITSPAARPYALLLIRPSGAEEFHACRYLLRPLVGEYGYEFVEADFQYELPPATEEAAQQCRDAVENAFRISPPKRPVGSLAGGPGGFGKIGGGAGGFGDGSAASGDRIPTGPIDVERIARRPAASTGFFGSKGFRDRNNGDADGNTADGNFESVANAIRSGSWRGETSRNSEDSTGRNASATDGGERGSRDATGPGTRSQRPMPRRLDQSGSSESDEGTSDVNSQRQGSQSGSRQGAAGTSVGGENGQSNLRGLSSGSIGSGSAAGAAGTSGSAGGSPSDSASTAAGGRGAKGDSVDVKGLKRWGLSDPNASLGLEKPMTLVVESSRIVIDGKYQVTTDRDQSTTQSVNRCVRAMDQVAKEWGRPAKRFYWVPAVTLEVMPGGAQLAQLLKTTLEESGASVEFGLPQQ